MDSWRSVRRCATPCLAFALVLSGFVLGRAGEDPGSFNVAADVVAAEPQRARLAPAPEPEEAPQGEEAPELDAVVKPKPVVVVEQSPVPEPTNETRDSDLVAELPTTRTKPFAMVGVTWSADSTDEDVKVQVRTRTRGAWSGWEALNVENDSDPEGRHGTDPLWVGASDGVAARVTSPSGSKPGDIKIATVDPGTSDTEATVVPALYATGGASVGGVTRTTAVVQVVDGAPTYTPQPSIVMRSAWGAAAGTPCDSPRVGNTTKGAIVHHTAGANDYAASESAAIVRGTQAYHMRSRGWCDIGYNFLVDKYGQIFEGRRGGINQTVRAAHSGNLAVNTYTMGVSMMGHLDKVRPTAAMQASMVKLIGWRMGTTYMKAKGTYGIDGKTLNRIAGHRNVISTGCPGRYGYEWLTQTGGLRDRVEGYIAAYSSRIKTRAASLGAATTGPVFIGEARTAGGTKTRFGKVDIYSKSGFGTRFVSAAGGFRSKYASFGSQRSLLRFPKSDSPAVSTSGTFAQRFENGSIFAMRSSSVTTTHALWGPIAIMYGDLSEWRGTLGKPTTSVRTESGGFRATFVNGYIRYFTSTSKTVAYNSSGSVIATSTPGPTANTVTIPTSRTFVVKGHGFGHGIGMGQYGAQNAAIQGLTSGAILRYYYPGTTVSTFARTMRVLISKDTTVSVVVEARSGLIFRNLSTKATLSLPSTTGGATISQWRISPRSDKPTASVLQRRTASGWATYKSTEWTGAGQFEASGPITLRLPIGSATYRGALRSALPTSGSTTRDTVNVVSAEDYLRGVVPAEMPSSWRSAALRAQSVAARTYAARAVRSSRHYDICDTTSCQVYRGTAVETASTDSAIVATVGRILTYDGAPAFTQFSSSSGGWSAAGSAPYLKLKIDAYDDWSGNPNHNWSRTVNASTLEQAYPAIGSLRKLTVIKRTGGGSWGGRVTTLTLTGSKGSVSISGTTARRVMSLKSHWFAFGG